MKKLFLISSILILICLASFFLFVQHKESSVSFIKNSIEKFVHNIPIIKKNTNLLKDVSVKQQRKHEGLMRYFLDNYTDYTIDIYDLPFSNYYIGQDKPTGYVEQYDNRFILASGNGKFNYFNKSEIKNNSLFLTEIETNIKNLINDNLFYTVGSRSIKDIKIINDYLYVTYTKEVEESCYNISVIRAKFNFEYLKFNEVFSPMECHKDNYRKQSGGRIHSFKENKIIISVGVFDNNKSAQKIDNMFGKIISFIPNNNDYEILSLGHRNPQGLFYDFNDDVIINTEHQALGGDEINVNLSPNSETIKNYGWPISSYGEHYGRKQIEDEPLFNNHKKHGFLEPIKYFEIAIGISQIIKVENENSPNKNEFIIASMGHGVNEGGDMSLHKLTFDNKYSTVLNHEIIPIGERIRDIEQINNTEDFIMVLESIPAVAILKKKNYTCDKLQPPCNLDQTYERTIYDQNNDRNNVRENYYNLLPKKNN